VRGVHRERSFFGEKLGHAGGSSVQRLCQLVELDDPVVVPGRAEVAGTESVSLLQEL
jgi:hypothetical protein